MMIIKMQTEGDPVVRLINYLLNRLSKIFPEVKHCLSKRLLQLEIDLQNHSWVHAVDLLVKMMRL